MSYQLEAMVYCDGCDRSLGRRAVQDTYFRSAKNRITTPRVDRVAETVDLEGGGNKHLCRQCKGDDNE